MDRLDNLKRLKDEVSRLFHEGLNEKAVFDQIRTDEQFVGIRYEQVHSFYSHLQEKSNVEAESKQQIATLEQKITKYERKLATKLQMKTELESTVKHQQNSNKFLIYEEHFANLFDGKNFWQARFFMTVTLRKSTDNVYTIIVQDLFQGTAKAFKIQKLERFFKIYTLMFPFVLFHEVNISNRRIAYLRLMKFDFQSKSVQIIQLFDLNCYCEVLVSASDASSFLLRREDGDVIKCKLIGDGIKIVKNFSLKPDFYILRGSYFDEQLYSLQGRISLYDQSGNRLITRIKMLFYDVEQNQHSIYDIDSTPEGFDWVEPNRPESLAWIRDTVFFTVRFSLSGKYGVIFTNPQARNWKTLEFATDLQINNIQSFANETLMIYSEEIPLKRKIYKLQMRKPDFLRNMAWLAMVKLFKEAKIMNSYEKARQHLPLNSEIQPFVFD